MNLRKSLSRSHTHLMDVDEDSTGLDKQKSSVKMLIFSYPSVFTYVFGAQKKRLI